MAKKDKGKGIALLVPFRADGNTRREDWLWLQRYWKKQLPQAKIIVADDGVFPFGKSASVNAAARQARNCDIYAILDADAYLNPKVITDCARKIRQAKRKHRKLWYVPYRRFYRLTESATHNVLMSDPAKPLSATARPPAPADIDSLEGSAFGHWFGALVQVMPREAFIAAGGMDERFRGWGGEDVSFMHAVDTLYAKHKTTNNAVYHLWHEKAGIVWSERRWEGQEVAGRNNDLAYKYSDRLGDRKRMLKLVREGIMVRENDSS
jgi:hypothetical protein